MDMRTIFSIKNMINNLFKPFLYYLLKEEMMACRLFIRQLSPSAWSSLEKNPSILKATSGKVLMPAPLP
jgi:hypothetical protein